MKMRQRWLIIVGALAGLSIFTSACGDDDTSSPSGQGAGGTTSASMSSSGGSDGGGDTGGGGDAGSGDAGGANGTGGGDAGGASGTGGDGGTGGGDPEECGLPQDTDPEPKVRFINALLPNRPNTPVGVSDPPALRLYVNGAPVPDIEAVSPNRVAASVTRYAKVTAGAITFSARTDDGTSGGAGDALTISADPLTVPPGARYTIVAVGVPDTSNPTTPRLLIAEEKFTTRSCSEVALRFVNADYNSGNPKSFYIDRSATAAAALDWFTASAPEGVLVPPTTRSITVTASRNFGPTGQAPFSLSAASLVGGRSYFVIETGYPTRVMDDARAHGLLIVPAGDDSPAVFVKRDPLVYLFHASPPPTPSPLEVYSGTERIAINLRYAQAPTYTDLPPGESTLSIVAPGSGGGEGSGNTVVVGAQPTGPLEPGAIYLGGLLGSTGETGDKALQVKLWRVQPDLPGTLTTTRAMLINASATAPSVDLGYWSVNADGTRGDTFTPVLTDVAYASASASSGVDFAPPRAAERQWFGVRPAGSADAIRSVSGNLQPQQWYAAVLVGDWGSSDPASAAQIMFIRNIGIVPASTQRVLPSP